MLVAKTNRLLRCLACASVVLVHALPNVVAAQEPSGRAELRGRVSLAGDTAVPIVAADVELVSTGLRVVTDRDGLFRFASVTPGEYELRVRRLGHTSATRRVVVGAEGVNTADVELERAMAELSKVVIEGRRVKVPPRFGAVYERASRGWGKLFTREDIQQRNPVDLKTLLATLPGVQVNDRGLTFHRCQADLNNLSRALSGGQSSPTAKRRPGYVQVYVDGHRLTWTTDDQSAEADADQVISKIYPSSIEAMEVYTGVARIPAEFMSDACAAIVIWTKSY
jgi:hypothetical protein